MNSSERQIPQQGTNERPYERHTELIKNLANSLVRLSDEDVAPRRSSEDRAKSDVETAQEIGDVADRLELNARIAQGGANWIVRVEELTIPPDERD